MRVLIVSSRFPWPSYTGDRIRASIWLNALGDRAEVTLVAPRGDFHRAGVRFIPVRRSPIAFVWSALQAAVRGLPFHALITAGFDWKSAIAEAGEFDVVLVLLSRLHPWVHPHIRAKRKILDAIDSLAASVAQRADASRGVARLFWRMEARRTALLEKSIATAYETVLVVSDAEAAAFGERAVSIPNGVEIGPIALEMRTWDCAFWGRLGYFANANAALELLTRIWPAVRAEAPAATLIIAGADAPAAIRRFHGRDGVTVASPVADLRSLIRTVKIAVFPVRFGTGQSTKVLEAAEAGCALVATPQAVRGLAPIASESIVQTEPEKLAAIVVRLLRDDVAIRTMGEKLRTAVQQHYSREETLRRLRSVVGA